MEILLATENNDLGIVYVLAGLIAIVLVIVWTLFPFIVWVKFNEVVDLLHRLNSK